MIAVQLLLLFAALPVLAAAGYLAFLTFATFLPTRRPPASSAAPSMRFDVIVPAHEEEAGIAATVHSLLDVDYPAALRRVLVVADNCIDATAARASEAGAIVIVRSDEARRGKGYALERAIEQVEADDLADAVVIVDADTTVSRNLLAACADRMLAGAEAIQVDYTVRNPEASWRTRLMVIALALFHVLRSEARERLGWSAGLRGNGMAFRRALLSRVPYRAYSLVEDVEYGIALGEAGVAVRFAGEAQVFGEMVSGGAASTSQRRRWEEGRRALAREKVPALLRRALATRDWMIADLALDIGVPPLSTIAVATCLGVVAASVVFARSGHSVIAATALALWLAALTSLSAYVARGWAMSGTGLRGLLVLTWAPVYVAWKVGLALRNRARGPSGWVRTSREANRP
ncbi:MAG: glycosyltransferase family 2 protein [Polyangiales bacterium]